MKRYGNAFFIGLIFFVISFFLLFANEKSYVNSVKISNFAERNAIELMANTISPANEGKLVQVVGKVYSHQTLTDGIISVPKSIALFRDTEMYQWKEEKVEKNSDYTYNYRKIWSRSLIDSDNFNDLTYKNPKTFKYPQRKIYAKNVGLGKFYLSPEIVHQIRIVNKMQQLPYNDKFTIYNGFYFTGQNFDTPEIGAQKLFYSYIPSGIALSVIAQQVGNHLEQMHSKYGDFVIVTNGEKNLSQMLSEYRKNYLNQTWLFRGLGLFLMFFGLNLIIQPIVNSAKKVPLLGELTQMAALVITFILTIAFGTISISLCWLALRPEIALPLIIFAVFIIFNLKKKEKIIIPE